VTHSGGGGGSVKRVKTEEAEEARAKPHFHAPLTPVKMAFGNML